MRRVAGRALRGVQGIVWRLQGEGSVVYAQSRGGLRGKCAWYWSLDGQEETKELVHTRQNSPSWVELPVLKGNIQQNGGILLLMPEKSRLKYRGRCMGLLPISGLSSGNRAYATSETVSAGPSPGKVLLDIDPLQKGKEDTELKAVNTAVAANSIIMIAKLGCWSLSGSGAMLAESLHSLCDVLNQLLLRAGVMLSRRAPTRQHPYGFHREKYVYALMSAVGIFCIGSGASIVHGIQSLMYPPALDHMGYNLVVLGVSGGIELISLMVAYRILQKGASKAGRGVWKHVMSGRDPSTSAVLAEDAGAVAGLGIASLASYLSYMTGDPMYDAFGSIGVGVLMGGVAVTLIRNYKRFLIGRAIEPELQKKIIQHLKSDPCIICVIDPMSEEIGDGLYRFKADIQWSADHIVSKYLQTFSSKDELYNDIRSSACTVPAENDSFKYALDTAMMDFGRGVISTVGAEIDRLEAELRQLCPGLIFVDLETDRAASSVFQKGDRCMVSSRICNH